MFKLNQNADINMTHRVGTLCNVAPVDLLRVFGEPGEESGDGKINGAFYFDVPGGGVFTVYAYKRCVDWTSPFPIDWSIGGFNDEKLTEFVHWIRDEITFKSYLDDWLSNFKTLVKAARDARLTGDMPRACDFDAAIELKYARAPKTYSEDFLFEIETEIRNSSK